MDLDAALAQISEFVACACDFLTRGVALPGPDADNPQNDLRLAMPASPGYQRRKRSAFAQIGRAPRDILGRAMTGLADKEQRIRALTDLDATLLVEAAAGTGKTSLLAGRVVCLLAHAVAPREIAAITFTEFAAGELRERIAQYLDKMLSGSIPDELRIAFSQGPTQQRL